MNWEAVGAVGQVLGSIAVFVTLAYLALQVRHAQSETKRALSQSRMEANRELIALELDELNLAPRLKANAALGMSNPQVAMLMERAGLTLEEAWRVLFVEVAAWNYRVHVITQSDELNEPERALFDLALRARYGTPGVSRLLYDSAFKLQAHPRVTRYIEDVLGSADARGG